MFAWDKVTDTLCSSILYIISAVNCGVCPNTTADTNITCEYTQPDEIVDNNYTCMFAVQTEICGYLRGEKSKYLIAHIEGEQLGV